METMIVTGGYGSPTTQSIGTGGYGAYVPQTIFDYAPSPSLLAEYPDLREALEAGFYNKNILMLLGDFWSECFSEYETLKNLSTGVVTLMSSEYQHVLELVLSSSITDIPVVNKNSFGLVVFKQSEVTYGTTFGTRTSLRFPLQDGEAGPAYLSNTLFSPSILLVEGVHYKLSDGYIDFYVDIFEDDEITKQAYFAEDAQDKYILFWATDIALTEEHIYHRFGKFLYRREFNSANYKAIVKALQMFFTNTKTVDNIRRVFNVMFGLPITAYEGETVTAIEEYWVGEDPYHRITTDKNAYLASAYAELNVSVGDTLAKGTLLADLHDINDYISKPDWYENTLFPWDLVENYIPIDPGVVEYEGLRAIKDDPLADQDYLYQLMDAVLKFNIIKASLKLTYDNYEYYPLVRDTYGAVATGMPDYLYILYEVAFMVDFLDEYAEVTEADEIAIEFAPWQDDYPYRPYDENGDPTDPTIEFQYDGTIQYDGTYKYLGGPTPELFDDGGVYEVGMNFEEDAGMLMSTYVYDATIEYDGAAQYGESQDQAETFELAFYGPGDVPMDDPTKTILMEYGYGVSATMPGSAITETQANYRLPLKLSADCGSNSYDASDFCSRIPYAQRNRVAAVTDAGHRCLVEYDPTSWGTEAFLHVIVPFVTAGVDVTIHFFYDDTAIGDTVYVSTNETQEGASAWSVQPELKDARTTIMTQENGDPIVDGEGYPIVVEFGPIPQAYFTYEETSGPSPSVVQFTDKSVGEDLVEWYWDFGDGETSTEQNPEHSFTAFEDAVNTTLRARNRKGVLVYCDYQPQPC